MHSSFVVCERVDFIDDDPIDRVEVFAEFWRVEKDCKALRGGDEDVGWFFAHGGAFACGGVAGSYADSDAEIFRGDFLYLCEWFFEVFADVIGEGFKGGDVDRIHFIHKDSFFSRIDKFV